MDDDEYDDAAAEKWWKENGWMSWAKIEEYFDYDKYNNRKAAIAIDNNKFFDPGRDSVDSETLSKWKAKYISDKEYAWENYNREKSREREKQRRQAIIDAGGDPDYMPPPTYSQQFVNFTVDGMRSANKYLTSPKAQEHYDKAMGYASKIRNYSSEAARLAKQGYTAGIDYVNSPLQKREKLYNDYSEQAATLVNQGYGLVMTEGCKRCMQACSRESQNQAPVQTPVQVPVQVQVPAPVQSSVSQGQTDPVLPIVMEGQIVERQNSGTSDYSSLGLPPGALEGREAALTNAQTQTAQKPASLQQQFSDYGRKLLGNYSFFGGTKLRRRKQTKMLKYKKTKKTRRIRKTHKILRHNKRRMHKKTRK